MSDVEQHISELLDAVKERMSATTPPVTPLERAAQLCVDMLNDGSTGEFTMEDLHEAEEVGHKMAKILTEDHPPPG